jgi:hypothetical protein
MPWVSSHNFDFFGIMGQVKVSEWELTYTYVLYRSAWEIHYKDPDAIGANMAEFAIGSLSTLATKNPRIDIQGTVPYLGSPINISWPYAITLFASIAGVHLTLLASAIYATRLVVIKDDSNLSTARLLRPLVDHLG